MPLCSEGDTYDDGRDFVLHASSDERPSQHKRREPAAGDDGDDAVGEEPQSRQELGENAESNPEEAIENREDEFADHSDVEFVVLPESVFEAIEDTRDGLPTDDDPATSPPDPVDPAPAGKKAANRRKPRACPVCSKVYTAASSYFYHVKYFHSESKEHECEVCGRRFGTRASLVQHAPIHTGERRYECEVCDKRFGSRASLYTHRLTHAAERSWACAQCGKRFRSRPQLQRHVSRHAAAADRRHVCGTCARAFAVRADLLRHARTHTRPHPDDRYACDECHLKFAQPRYLKVHVKKKHS